MSQDLIRPEIRALSPYVVTSATGMVKLDAMENPYGLPDSLRCELGARLAQLHLNRYPDPNPESLKQQLRLLMGFPASIPLVLGNGSDELIQMLVLALACPGAVMLGVEPSFVMFRMLAKVGGMRFVGISLQHDFSLDREALAKALDEHVPALIFLAYPNNPTGNLFDMATMEWLLERSQALVVVDEAYYPFTAHSFVPRLLSHPRLLVMRTLSKLGLAGIRLGLLAGPGAVLEQVNKLRLPYNISMPDQEAALFALDHQAVFQSQTTLIREHRGELAVQLSKLPGVTVFPSEANFLLFRVGRAELVFDALRQRGILIKHVGAAHPLLVDCLRVTVGTPEENRQFISSLSAVLS